MSRLQQTIRMTRHSALLALCVAGALTLARAAHADEVKLKTGHVRQGRVVSENERYVVLETRLGSIRISASEVESITRTDAAEGTDGSTAGADAPPKRASVSRRRVTRRVDDAAEPTDAATDDSEANPAPAPDAAADDERAEDPDRLAQLRRSRVVRRTTSPAEERAADVAEKSDDATATEATATIGGLDLARVPQGTEVIVFQPPRLFEPAPRAIELGRRLVARMEMAGVKSAWMSVPGPEGEERVAVRLSDVKRHVDISDPSALAEIFQGVNAGDWVRVQLRDGTTVQGGFEGVADGAARVIGANVEGQIERKALRVSDVVQVDGMLRDRSAHVALSDLEPDELIAVTYWPDGGQIMGRYVESGAGVIAMDLDDDGTADQRVMRAGPIAEVLRVPARHRDLTRGLHAGAVVRLTFDENFDDAAVRRNHIGRVAALTAFSLAVDDGRDAMIVPFESISELAIIEDDPEEEVRKWNAILPKDNALEDFALLPGAAVEITRAGGLPPGVTTLDDGRAVTHVFISAPFPDEVFGVRIGEPVLQAVRRSPLRFHTTVMPRMRLDSEPEAQQTISESVEGVRFVILGDDLGIVTGIEMSRVE